MLLPLSMDGIAAVVLTLHDVLQDTDTQAELKQCNRSAHTTIWTSLTPPHQADSCKAAGMPNPKP